MGQSFSIFNSDLLIFSKSVLLTFRVRPFHFSESVLPTFRIQSFSFFDSDLLIFSGQSFPLFQVFPLWLLIFRVRPSHFFRSILLILSSKLLFDYFESILQFIGLIRRCLNWDVNRKYIFQWRNWFRGDIIKLFLCRVYVHWNFRIFKCVPWTPN